MKKLLSLTLALTLLSACSSYEPDMDTAAKERSQKREEIRQTIGCQFADDHAAYRKCLISTYESSKPKTFAVATGTNGQPIAVVSNGELKPTDPSLLMGNGVNGVGMIAPCTLQTQEMYETVLQPAPVEAPKVVTVSTTETITEKPVEVVPAPAPLPDKTWWETHQENKPAANAGVVCPCPDPNEPCPQCVTK